MALRRAGSLSVPFVWREFPGPGTALNKQWRNDRYVDSSLVMHTITGPRREGGWLVPFTVSKGFLQVVTSKPSSETKFRFLWQQKRMISSICWSMKSISVGRSLQVTSRTNPGYEPFWRSSTAISGSLLPFDAAEDVSPSWCFMFLTCRTFLGKEPLTLELWNEFKFNSF